MVGLTDIKNSDHFEKAREERDGDNNNLYFGLNWDVFFSRQLHQHLKALEGDKLFNEGMVVSSSSDLDIENDDFYITKNINGWSFKIIASF